MSQAALEAAMKAAVASGMIAKHADEQTYLRNWEGMKSVIAAALAAQPAENCNQNNGKFLVEFDDWSSCHSTSGFQVLMPYIPAKGQSIRIHKSLVSSHFSEDAYYDFDQIDDGCAEFTINHVEHIVDASGVSTRIDICHEQFTLEIADKEAKGK